MKSEHNVVMELLNRYKKYIFILLAVAAVAFVGYKFISKQGGLKSILPGGSDDDNYSYSDGVVKADTLEKYGFTAVENYVIKEVADVRRTPNFAPYNTIHKLKFGTKIYTKEVNPNNPADFKVDMSLIERESKNDYVAIYASKPVTLSEMPVGFLAKEDFIKKENFKDFKPEPKKPEKINIDPVIKATIEDNYLINDVEYRLPEKIKRYNKSIAYGDFNGDGVSDFAVVLDNFEATNSAVMIYFFNTEKMLYDLVYKKAYDGLLEINGIPNNTPVSVNGEMTTFPLDGFQLSGATGLVYVYNPDGKNFLTMSN